MFTKRKSLLLGFLAAATATGLALGVNGVVDAYVGEPAEVSAASGDHYERITSNLDDWSGRYLIVYESGSTGNVFDGSLSTLDAVSNYVSASIASGVITWSETLEAAEFSISQSQSGYNILSASGKYVFSNSNSNGLSTSDSIPSKVNSISVASDGVDIVSSSAHLRFNSASNQMRFRYYKSSSYTGQKPIQLYKFVSGVTLPDFDHLELSGTFTTDYFEGDSLNLAGIVVTAFYSDGSSKVLGTEEYTVSPSIGTPLKTTDTSFTITYTYRDEQYTFSQPITVEPRVLESIAVTKNPTKVNYVVGQSLDTTGIVVTGTYEGGATADLTSDCAFSPTLFETAGDQVITVTHTPSGKTASFNVTVAERKVSSISLNGKVEAFDAGQTFTLGDGAELTAIWNDGSETPLSIDDEGVLVELFSNLSGVPGQGKKIDSSYVLTAEDDGLYVNISYGGKSARKYQISVREVIDVSNGSFYLVNDVSNISIGDNIVIAGTKSKGSYAIGTTQNSNNRAAVEVSIVNDKIDLAPNGDVQIIKIEAGYQEGTFSMAVAGGYLGVFEDDNRLTTGETVSINTSWILSGGDVASIKPCAYPSRSLKLNTSSDLMACYTSGQTDVSIYKFATDHDVVTNFVDTYMHMSDYNDNENKCYGVEGYYAKAKEALVKLADEQIELFKTDSEFTEAHARYLAWAAANGDNSPYSGEYVSPAMSIHNSDDLMDIAVISALAIAGIAAAGAFVFLRRKKEA